MLLASLVLFPNVADAQDATKSDKVWLAPTRDSDASWFPQAITTRVGEIRRLDDQQLRMVFSGEETESIMAADRVLWIDPGSLSQKQSEAITLFAE